MRKKEWRATHRRDVINPLQVKEHVYGPLNKGAALAQDTVFRIYSRLIVGLHRAKLHLATAFQSTAETL